MPELPPSSKFALFRILDANQNRSREALRTIEEYLRFTLDDAHLTQTAKQLRHRLQAVMAAVPREELLACRDTAGDCGTEIVGEQESQRANTTEVLTAAFSRLQESLRAMEEYGKTFDPALAANLEQLRYSSYSLEKAVATTDSSVKRLATCQLYALIEGFDSEATFSARVTALISAGVDAIQLRDKRLNDRALLSRAACLRSLTAGSATLCIINDRPDIAALSRADGVHVGQEELPVSEVRRIVGTRMLIGVSTHSIEQARAAVLDGANYLGVGPVFTSPTKQFDHFPGLDFVREVAAEIRLPAFAIGGIGLTNVEQVTAAGLHRIALSGAIDRADDLANTVATLRDKLQND